MAQQHEREHDELRSWAEERDNIWRIAFGPLIWVLHFVLTYGGTTVVCYDLLGLGLGATFVRVSIAAITVIALAGIAWIAWRSWRSWDYLDDYDWEQDDPIQEDRHQFLGHASFLLALLSAVAVVYVALPAVFVSTCE